METKEIKFYNDTLLGVKDERGQVWLAIAHTCKELGLNERRVRQQGEKIRMDKVLSKGIRKFGLLTNGGEQEVYCLHERFVPLWFAKISLTKKMEQDTPNVVEKLEKYQLEAAEVLHKAFYKTEEQKQKFHDDMGLAGEIVELKQEIKDLKENVQTLIDNSTINMKQQKVLYNLGNERICFLLGGKKSKEYKELSKLYFANLWGDIKRKFNTSGSYHDLNPKDYKHAKDFIVNWEYIE